MSVRCKTLPWEDQRIILCVDYLCKDGFVNEQQGLANGKL